MSKYTSYQDRMDSGLERVVLAGSGCMAQIVPGAGLNLYSWIVGGREFMMPTRDIGAGGAGYGNPILFPTPNRVRNCTYTFRGKTHKMQKHGKPLFLHGLVTDELFTCRHWSDGEGAYCEGSFRISEQMGAECGYPFPCLLTVKISFCENGITMDFTVTNEGREDMPFGIAIHPYFTKTGNPMDVTLRCPAPRRFAVDEKLLPSGELLPNAGDARYDLSSPRPIGECDIDTVYEGMDSSKTTRIEFCSWGKAITLNADDAFGKSVIYTPPQRPGFCVEPQTNSTDFINLNEKGVEESGIRILAPGKTWTGQIRIGMESL